MSLVPFNPSRDGTIVIPNALVASAPALIADAGGQIALYNSSLTATAFIKVATIQADGDAGVNADVTTSMPIPPGAQIRLTVGLGRKKISAIATAADGNLYVTPGQGD